MSIALYVVFETPPIIFKSVLLLKTEKVDVDSIEYLPVELFKKNIIEGLKH
jgi:hypothetical protein